MTDVRVIKKYPNRRLYDTSSSKYITLDDIKQLVLNNIEFKVLDVKSEKDITHSTLMQIITEQEETGSHILTTKLLRHIIQFYDNSLLRSTIGRYLEQSIAFFVAQQKALSGKVTKVISQTPLSVISDIGDRNIKLWKQLYKSTFDQIASSRGKKKQTDSDETD